jgi:hypothetical protein
MTFSVTYDLRDVETGETRRCYDTLEMEDPASVAFYFVEGNMSCDCNRSRAYEQACGIEPDKVRFRPCGESRFFIEWLKIDGEMYVRKNKYVS